jgi:hypothetical protein
VVLDEKQTVGHVSALLLRACMHPKLSAQEEATLVAHHLPLQGAVLNNTPAWMQKCAPYNDTHAYAGQLNSITRLRALLVLHDRGI